LDTECSEKWAKVSQSVPSTSALGCSEKWARFPTLMNGCG